MAYLYRREMRAGKVWHAKYKKDGKWVYVCLNTTDKREARDRLEDLILNAPQASLSANDSTPLSHSIPTVPVPSKDMTFAEFKLRYFAWAKVNKRPNSVALDEVWLTTFLRTVPGKTMGQVTPDDAEAYKRGMVKKGKAPNTINGALRVMNALYNKAIRKGWIDCSNPFATVERLKEPKRPPRYLTTEEIELVITTAKEYGEQRYKHERTGKNLLLGVALALYGGLRKNEVVNARWDWVDFAGKTLRVLNGGDFTTKSGKFRVIPLHPKLAEILQPYAEQAGYILEATTANGKGRYRAEVRDGWVTLCKALGIAIRFHDLRHSFASQLAINNVSLFKISRWLGHSNITTTQIYAHLQDGYDPEIERF